MKKMILCILIIFVFILTGCSDKEDTTSKNLNYSSEIPTDKKESSKETEKYSFDINPENGKYKTNIIETSEGTIYRISNEEIKADKVVGDNYFATQVADIFMNFDSYVGKTVEIEGFVLNNTPYTFVSRRSESAICPDCPPGYAYFEYEWHGDELLSFDDETTWIKVIGEFKMGNDGEEYPYIDAYSIEVMNEWGQETVLN